MSRKVKIITTEDGSHTLFLPELREMYHSFHGAFKESIHVYMIYGLDSWLMRNHGVLPLRIFEMGFGTGLNAWLTLVWAEQNKIPVLYHTIEPFPIEKEIYSKLNYTDLDDSIFHYSRQFKRLHEATWNEGFIASEYFNMKKEIVTLEEAVLYPTDVVFYDAFAPSKQPELWTKEILAKVVETMNPGAAFTTYSSQNQLKTHLSALGLTVETLPGPPGKKEMTRAWKKTV